MNEEKKSCPKWLKIGGGILAGAAALGGAYLVGRHIGTNDDSDFADEFQDVMIDAAEDDSDVEVTEF